MKNLLFTLASVLLFVVASWSQVGINTDGASPHASAILDVDSDTLGLLIPRMTSGQISNISSPATGLIVYQTDPPQGIVFNIGTPGSPEWVPLVSESYAAWLRNSSLGYTYLNDTTDNVGIGISNPGTKLMVNSGGTTNVDELVRIGNDEFSRDDEDGEGIRIGTNKIYARQEDFSVDDLEIGIYNNLSGGGEFGAGGGGIRFKGQTGSNTFSTLMRLSSDGRVGIGPNYPDYRLDIRQHSFMANQDAYVRIDALSQAENVGLILSRADNPKWYLKMNTDLYYHNSLRIASPSDEDILVITPSPSRVAIGHEVPSEMFSVEGNAEFFGDIVLSDNSSPPGPYPDYLRLYRGGGNDGIIDMYHNSTLTTHLDADGDNYMTNANLGIGTSTPTAKLHIADGSIKTHTSGVAGSFGKQSVFTQDGILNASGDFSVIIPPAVYKGWFVDNYIFKIDVFVSVDYTSGYPHAQRGSAYSHAIVGKERGSGLTHFTEINSQSYDAIISFTYSNSGAADLKIDVNTNRNPGIVYRIVVKISS